MATIKSVFCKTRTEARQAKADYNGKIIDNGTGAPAGERWEVQYTIEAPKSEAVAELAQMLGQEVVDHVLEPVQPRDLLGLPLVGSRRKSSREYTLKDRKGNLVTVLKRRSVINSMLAAHMARL